MKMLHSLVLIIMTVMGPVQTFAQEPELKDFLKQPYLLSPKYKMGEKNFYHMQTVYLTMNDSGRVAQTQILDGYFIRECVGVEDGKHINRFKWKWVRKGQKQGKGKIETFQVMPYTVGFQYHLSIEDWEPDHFPVDLSSIPRTLEGWSFVVKLIDAHTFDAILRLDAYEKPLTVIGDRAILPAEGVPVAMDFPPLFTDTFFINADFWTTFQGLTLYQDEPCAILFFRSDDSFVRMVVNMMDMKLPTEGVSYYWGTIYLSLNAGKIMRGNISERVDAITQSFVEVGKPMRQVVRREITLERIDSAAYESISLDESKHSIH